MTPDALDITVGVILFLSMLIAYFRGIIREVFTIVALIAAMGSSYYGGSLMVPPFEKWLHVDTEASKQADEQAAQAVSKAAGTSQDAAIVKGKLAMGIIAKAHMAQICAYGSVFLFIYLVMSLVGFFITRAVAEAGLGIVDRLLGAGFGLARGFLVVFLTYLPVWYFYQGSHDPMPDWAKNSVSVPVLDKAVAFADEHLEFTKMIQKRGDALVLKLQQKRAAEEAKTQDDATISSHDDEKELQDELKDEEKQAPPK
ncbi:MAG: CvpA family protein [Alphaproteobacteria bacterium]|nr:MAG: CvpA family protein [Alphaproteobacteria bacterium]